MIKILKLLTVISFLSIIMNGEHIGGPIGLFIFFELFQPDTISSITSILCIVILIIFIYSIIKPTKAEFRIFVIGGIILIIPIIQHIIYLINYINFVDERPFLLTLLIFIIIFSLTLIKIYKMDLQLRNKNQL